MYDAIRDNGFLFAVVGAGFAILGTSQMVRQSEMFIAIGAAFIISGIVGIYMMLATRNVARKLHERFNEQQQSLNEHTKILRNIESTQKDTVSSLKRIEEILERKL